MHGFYDEHFANLVRGQSPEYLKQVNNFLTRILNLPLGSQILDQGCGLGQISRVLAQAGFDVLGFDINVSYIQEAQNMAVKSPDLKLNFVCGDAREYIAEPAVDAVISWHTSFGHHLENQDQLAVLRSAYQSLKPGGQLVLDYPNFYHTLRHFEPVFVQEYPFDRGRIEVKRHSQIDAAKGLLHQRWEFLYPDRRQAERQAALKIYLPHELIALLNQAGFQVLNLYGNLEAQAFDFESQRCILQAQRSLTDEIN